MSPVTSDGGVVSAAPPKFQPLLPPPSTQLFVQSKGAAATRPKLSCTLRYEKLVAAAEIVYGVLATVESKVKRLVAVPFAVKVPVMVWVVPAVKFTTRGEFINSRVVKVFEPLIVLIFVACAPVIRTVA